MSVSAPLLDRPQEAPGPPDLFGVIVGHETTKEIFNRALASPEPVHVLLIGPPATAKTVFLEAVERAFRGNAWFALGGSTKKAGLARLLADRRPRALLVDELEKMGRDDFAALLSLMESGRISETKTGRTHQDRLTCWVFAAGNSDEKLPPELLSRFVRVRLSPYSDAELQEVMARMLQAWERTDRPTAEAVAEACLRNGLRDVRDARKVRRMLRPGEHPEAVAALLATARGAEADP